MNSSEMQTLCSVLVEKTRRQGADAVEVIFFQNTDFSVDVRQGKIDSTDRAEGHHLGIRAFVGQCVASVSTSDLSSERLDSLAERVVDMARQSPHNPYAGLATPDLLAKDFPALDLADSYEPSLKELSERAKNAEEAGLATQGITNSEGATAAFGRYGVVLATSHGFLGGYEKTMYSLSCSVVAGEGTGMERDYDYSVKSHWSDLDDSAQIGQRAGMRAVKRLNPRKIQSGHFPVIFERRIASSLLGHLEDAICGTEIARKTSFLLDFLGQDVFSPHITITDNPHLPRALGSSPFDAEGVSNLPLTLVDKGVLKEWLLDCSTARQLGLSSNGRSKRGTGSASTPCATNLTLQAGDKSLETLLKDMGTGILITELIGFGVNEVTGDYSRGASGFWVEKGEIAYPVSEITIAGNLKEMFKTLLPANDLEMKARTNSPSLLISGMTVAGL